MLLVVIYSVVPVRQITHPENVTIDLAIDSLLSRTILALFLTTLSILVAVAALWDILVEYPRMKRLIRMMNRGSCQLALYELDLEKCGQSNKISYDITMDGKVFSFTYEMKNKKTYTNPILIKCNQSLYVLVIASLDNEAFLIVDEGLHRFALNKKSRKALREKIEQYINQP